MVASFRSSLLPVTLLLAASARSGSGFASPRGDVAPRCRRDSVGVGGGTALPAAVDDAFPTRRDFFAATAAAAAAILPLSTPLPALAKEEPPPPTRAAVAEAFDAIRLELTSPTGVYNSLSSLIENGSFEEILQYTKESDAYFRKAKLGKARKLLTDKDLKGRSIEMSNAVTFDLIGINRASRPGKENREEQLRYLGELKKDVEIFLELEGTIDVID